MNVRRVRPWTAGVCALLLALSFTTVSAQVGRGTVSLTGIVVDSTDRVVSGATVVVTDQATGVAIAPVQSNADGIFSFPALQPGRYTVTAALAGFKTAAVRDIRILTGVPADLGRIRLEPGQVTERVEVVAPAELVQTRTSSVTSTIASDQITNLPLITRNVLNFVTFLPGVDVGGTHNQRTNVQIAGLPQSTLSITIDGVNSQDNYNKTLDGFFSIITPTLDAIHEATVTSAALPADMAGQGAVQIRLTTRSGTSEYRGTLYDQIRHPRMNANSFFNVVNRLPKNQLKLQQLGGSLGGPLLPRSSTWRDRAFFFANYEVFRQPFDIARTRTILSDAARAGDFRYTAGGTTRTVNVLSLAAANGQTATVDPVIGALLADITAAAKTTGTLTPNADPNTSSFAYLPASTQARHLVASRFDLNFTDRHRLTSTYYFQKYNTDPDLAGGLEPKFPGFPNHGAQYSYRNLGSATLRSVLRPNLVSETVFGFLWAPVYSWSDVTRDQFANQGGFSLGFAGNGPAFAGLTIPTAGSNSPSSANGNNPSSRNAWDWNVSQHLYWQRGQHSLHAGGSLFRFRAWTQDQQPAPSVTFGVNLANDPAAAMFDTRNFPGATSGALNDARHLYALLTGRVASIQGQLALDDETGRYVYGGVADRRVHMTEASAFIQDSWLLRPNLTLNFGVRYELQLPIAPDASLYSMVTVEDACGVSGVGNGFGTRCNLFSPGTLEGTPTAGYRQYDANRPGYNTDLNNFAPNVGVAWLPDVQGGWLRSVLGDPAQAVVRAGYGRAYTREGLRDMANRFESNPGVFVQDVLNATAGLVRSGERWPVLFRDTGRLGPGDFNPEPIYPLPVSRNNGINLYDPDWQVGYADSFTAGFQRGLSRNMAVEVRYVGTWGRQLRETENWNEVDFVENGFLDEFTLAQQNLYANLEGPRRLASMAYMGPGTGTSPLPTLLGFLTGQPASVAGDPARYGGAAWLNPGFAQFFQRLNPQPHLFAQMLNANAGFRANAAAAGIPINYFQLNPHVGNIIVDVSRGFTRYHSLQVDLRRHLSSGFAFDVNYTYGRRWVSRLDSLRTERYLVRSADEVPHALKLTTTYDLPLGRGRRFGTDWNRWLDGLAGGWQLNLTGKVQSGRVINVGNVRLVGMTEDELEDAIEYRITRGPDGTTRVFNLPQDIIDNTVRAFMTSVEGYAPGAAPTGRYIAPANGPDCIQANIGDCAPKDVIVTAPKFTRFDASAKKTIPLGGRKTFTFEVNVMNLFNAVNFNPVIPTFPNPDAFRLTSSYSDPTITFDPGSRIGQVLLRFSF